MHCWNGKHHRCTGWLVIPDDSDIGRKTQSDQSIRCECPVCPHPPISRLRHVHKATARGASWSSSMTIPS